MLTSILGMRVCTFCKKQEGRDHSKRCPYYRGMMAYEGLAIVTVRTALIEDEDGCPLVRWDKKLDADCDGCIECIDKDES